MNNDQIILLIVVAVISFYVGRVSKIVTDYLKDRQ